MFGIRSREGTLVSACFPLFTPHILSLLLLIPSLRKLFQTFFWYFFGNIKVIFSSLALHVLVNIHFVSTRMACLLEMTPRSCRLCPIMLSCWLEITSPFSSLKKSFAFFFSHFNPHTQKKITKSPPSRVL